jgi:hypothetical protein
MSFDGLQFPLVRPSEAKTRLFVYLNELRADPSVRGCEGYLRYGRRRGLGSGKRWHTSPIWLYPQTLLPTI